MSIFDDMQEMKQLSDDILKPKSAMKAEIDQYLAANVFDNQPPSNLTLHGGDQLQKEVDHLWEDVIKPRVEELEAELEAVKKITRDKYRNANEVLGLDLGREVER